MFKAINGKEAKMVRYILPSVGADVELDRHCHHCRHRHGVVHSGLRSRLIRDPKVASIRQQRMKCPRCGMTWTLRAVGVNPGYQRTNRARGLGMLGYMLGLSYRGVEMFLTAVDCPCGKSSVDRDVAAAGQRASALHRAGRKHLRVMVLGADGTGAAMAGRDEGLLFLVDIGNQRLIGVEMVDEGNADQVRQIIREVMAQVGATELRTDEHNSYEGIMPEGAHRLCLTHWLKSKGKRAWDLLQQAKLEQRPLEVATMEELLALLRKRPRSPTVPDDISRLVRRYVYARKGLPWKINQLLQHVERTWEKVSDDPVDPTNNVTERIIGLTFKIRSKTMRGFKTKRKVIAHPHLSFYLRGQDGLCDLGEVV
jgi:hypothetical protein